MSTSFYCDTSALVKLYHREASTNSWRRYFRQEDKTLMISELAIVEFYSTLARRDSSQARSPWRPRRRPIGNFETDCQRGVLLLLPLAVL